MDTLKTPELEMGAVSSRLSVSGITLGNVAELLTLFSREKGPDTLVLVEKLLKKNMTVHISEFQGTSPNGPILADIRLSLRQNFNRGGAAADVAAPGRYG